MTKVITHKTRDTAGPMLAYSLFFYTVAKQQDPELMQWRNDHYPKFLSGYS